MRDLLLAALVLLAASCAPSAAYVKADRLTYEALVHDDIATVGSAALLLTEDERKDRSDTYESWRRRLEGAERSGG